MDYTFGLNFNHGLRPHLPLLPLLTTFYHFWNFGRFGDRFLAQGLIFGLSFGSWGQVFSPVLAHGASFGHSFGPGGNRQNEYSDDPGWKHQRFTPAIKFAGWNSSLIGQPRSSLMGGLPISSEVRCGPVHRLFADTTSNEYLVLVWNVLGPFLDWVVWMEGSNQVVWKNDWSCSRPANMLQIWSEAPWLAIDKPNISPLIWQRIHFAADLYHGQYKCQAQYKCQPSDSLVALQAWACRAWQLASLSRYQCQFWEFVMLCCIPAWYFQAAWVSLSHKVFACKLHPVI